VLARVSQNGNVNVPLIGEVPVAGIEPFEAGERIAAAAVQRGVYRQPAVVLKVEEPAVNRVTVLGAVTKPGVKKVPRGSSDVLSAVAAAGGFSKDASTQVEVMHQYKSTFMASTPVDGVVTASFEEPSSSQTPVAPDSRIANNLPPSSAGAPTYRLDLAQADPTRRSDYRVGDGDVVMVLPEEERVIHVSGLVNKPDQFKIPRNQDVHVLDAIAMAGGIKSPVADKVYVIRRIKDMPEPAVIEVSIAKAKRDGNENLRLASGDLVSVESTPLTQFVDTMTTFFNVGLGLGGNVSFF
jgi:polysaccharide export outer membrane protein